MIEVRTTESHSTVPTWVVDLCSSGIDALQEIVDALPVALVILDPTRERVLLGNEQCCKLWGLPSEFSVELLAASMTARAADPEQVLSLWTPALVGGSAREPWHAKLELTDRRSVEWSWTPLQGEHEKPWGELHVFSTQAPLAPPADALFLTVFERASIGIALIAVDGRFLRTNDAFGRLLGYDEHILLTHNVGTLLHPDDAGRNDDWCARLTHGEETFHLELRCVHRTGIVVWLYLSVTVIRDQQGQSLYGMVLAEDITARKQREEEQERRTQELMTLASTDPLTGLFNPRYMREGLDRLVENAKQTEQPLSLVMLDADQFRELNLQHGHDAGDRALRCLADAIRQSLREGDVACRYGGDEFLVILAGVGYPAALRAAERVRRNVEEAGRIAALAEPLTCSVGVATLPTHASTSESLLKAADLALFRAKHEGKNRVVGFDAVAPDASPAEIEQLQSGLQGASVEAVNALVTAIDLRDRFTGAHCQRVARVALELARRMDMSAEELEAVRLGAALLDVGKIGLPDTLLTKEGKLTQAEWTLIRKHPEWGEQLLRKSALPEAAVQIVRWHHERLDGSGYPDALTGEQIPRTVRVVSVADVATALREDRPHRRAWPRERVREYLTRHAGERLDADAVRAWCELYPA
jgi:diguanylate cyclase (GGDEF)-like protein/PAS domain S-box-containing protein/putative nucleotidyltransferase with HDIG domain